MIPSFSLSTSRQYIECIDCILCRRLKLLKKDDLRIPGSLGPGVVVPIKVLSMSQIDKNY